MAAGITKIADVIVPSQFTAYVNLLTEEKSRLVQSGAVTIDPTLQEFLNGPDGGMTVTLPAFNDLDNDAENVSSDNEASPSSPNKIGSNSQVAIRLNRNQSWSSMDLTADLISADPMEAIANRVADYRVRRLQALLVATMTGVFADNDLAPGGGDTHTQFDLTEDITGAYTPGVTDFSAEAFIDALQTMGDSADSLTMVMMHSVVFARAQKNNLIDFIPDARAEVDIPTFLGRQVIVDDGLPNAAGSYDTWLFGAGAITWAQGDPRVPTAVDRDEAAGDGGGQETLFNRWKWIMHPVGHAWVGSTTASGGPTNTVIDDAASWSRVFPERKQIRIARLQTTES